MSQIPRNDDFTIFEKIGDQSPDVYFVYDLNSKSFVYLNDSVKAILGISREEIFEMNPETFLEKVHVEDRLYLEESWRLFLKNDAQDIKDFRIHRSDDDERWIRAFIFPVFGTDSHRLVAGFLQDDSDRKKNMLLMQNINARKNSMLEILSHDLKGPIGIVQMLASAIEMRLPEQENEQILIWIQQIKQISKRNIALIRDFVNTEFLESAAVEIGLERIDMVFEINDIIKNYQKSQLTISKMFKLSYSHDQIYAHVDSMKFMQVINNLISNSIKFTDEGGVISVDIQDQIDKIVISVEDDGIGIPLGMQPFLFDKFTRARRKGLKGEESVGLGMSIIKTIVELHRGRIWFESEEGKGCKFFIELPLKS